MTLYQWLRSQPYGTQRRLAKACGCTESMIRKVSARQKAASVALAIRIEAATGGAVTLAEIAVGAKSRAVVSEILQGRNAAGAA